MIISSVLSRCEGSALNTIGYKNLLLMESNAPIKVVLVVCGNQQTDIKEKRRCLFIGNQSYNLKKIIMSANIVMRFRIISCVIYH